MPSNIILPGELPDVGLRIVKRLRLEFFGRGITLRRPTQCYAPTGLNFPELFHSRSVLVRLGEIAIWKIMLKLLLCEGFDINFLKY